MKPMYKTTITIWSAYDMCGREADRVVAEAYDGDAQLADSVCRKIEDPSKDPDWMEDLEEYFFADDEEEEESEDA